MAPLIPTYHKMMNNLHSIEFNGMTFYYSYDTLIAFKDSQELLVAENKWGASTGKHLNAIDNGDKKNRITHTDLLWRVRSIMEFILEGNKR